MSARGGASSFRHTPYADRLKAFSIGLRPISKAQWIEVDEHLSADLAAKVKIFSEEGVEAFDELACSGVAQDEALDLLAVHLPLHFPDLYRALPAGLTVEGRSVAFEAPKLRAAAQLVQEDLLLMQRFDDGWRLTAGALCFPATWRLGEKLGKPMGEIHAPVPGYAGQMAERIARIFDALPADDLVERFNLSIYYDIHSHARRTKSFRRTRRSSIAPMCASNDRRCENSRDQARYCLPFAPISIR